MDTDAQWDGAANCSRFAVYRVEELLNRHMLMRVNAVIVVNVIFVGILVGIGAYMPHYRYRSVFRVVFLGATTLLLPSVSYVVSNGSTTASTLSEQHCNIFPGLTLDSSEIMFLRCETNFHLHLIILWVGLAQIVGINTSIIVAADDREGQNNGLHVQLLAQVIWTSYLAVYELFGFHPVVVIQYVFAPVIAKMVLKYFAYWMARRSLAHGRNPRFIVGYMMQLHERRQHVEQQVEITSEQLEEGRQQVEQELVTTSEQSQMETHLDIICKQLQEESHKFQLLPPPLIVMGEERQKVAKQPHGYYIRQRPNKGDITMVTIDRIWQLDDTFMRSMPRAKDVCFSFALFKLLRSQFAGYTVIEAGFTQAHNFFWYELIKESGTSITAERVFSIIEDELSFLHDYYYTALPMSYSKSWLPIFSILTSLLTVVYCLYIGSLILNIVQNGYLGGIGQINCGISCGDTSDMEHRTFGTVKIGRLYFEIALVFLLLALVVLAEVRNIASYIFSNWTKVAFICRYVIRQNTRQRPYCIHKLFNIVLEENRWKLTKPLMNQCSVLVLHPMVLLTHLQVHLWLSDRTKSVKVPTAVKVAIISTLRRSNGIRGKGGVFMPPSQQDGNNFIWDCSDKGAAHTVLICHIATSLLEARYPHPTTPTSDDKITATHLSRYCAYLVAHAPDLLPDDDKWCKSLYKAVKKNSLDVLANGASRYDDLVTLLSGADRHEVLQKGAALATQLVSLPDEEGSTAWSMLAVFWSEMVLLVASSSKVQNHTAAIARGGELITLLWALLMHAGPSPEPSTVDP